MSESMAATHAVGKKATDNIFGAAAAAGVAAKKYGADKVANATIGAILDEDEKLVCLPTVEKVWKELPMTDVINYAPIAGLPDFLEAAIDTTFSIHRPDAHISAIATSGGSGVLHHVVANYSEFGDTLLTSDWFWGPYRVICEDALRKLDTYTLFNDKDQFNLEAFSKKVTELLSKQKSVVIFLNTPAHNPTGFSLSNSDWDQIIAFFKECAKNKDKKIIPVIDVAYLDYAGEKDASREFFKKLGNLPSNILPIVGFSMSKGYTMYGQRTGAMIGISSSEKVIQEFKDINQYTSRATWSNINRGCMQIMATICKDTALRKQIEEERAGYYRLIHERAQIFVQEAQAVNLKMLPYVAGFFLSIPTDIPGAICDEMHKDNIFAVPLAKGIRIAVCAVPKVKMKGMAAVVAKAMAAVKA